MNGTFPRRVKTKPLKSRKYIHFDAALTEEQLTAFQPTAEEVAKHSFWPLLGYNKIKRQLDSEILVKAQEEGRVEIKYKKKNREIKYASHIDSAIYSVYSKTISERYEALLIETSLANNILAYRSGIGSNISFAKSLIDEIKSRGDCFVVCLDISKFFDNISHKVLKKNLCKVLACERLPDDWFKIFCRMTHFEFVLIEKLKVVLLGPKRGSTFRGTKICNVETFREKVRPIIEKNDKLRSGIPQGTPASGIFANISMLDFDNQVNSFIVGLGGSYRRYSDDVAIILPSELSFATVQDFVNNSIDGLGLKFNQEKTCKTEFRLVEGRQTYTGDLLQYLGFTFDGRLTLVRSESVKNFYARMKRNISRYIRAAVAKGIPLSALRKRVLIGRFTHLGDNKNFVQYCYRASAILEAPEIKRQLRRHTEIFNQRWVDASSKYGP